MTRPRPLVASLLLLGLVGCALLAPVARPVAPAAACPPEEDADDGLEQVLAPFLGRYCFECHDEREQASGLLLDAQLGRARRGGLAEDHAAWALALEMIATAEMPPPEAAARPGAAERERVVRWLRGALAAGPGPVAPDPGRPTLRRLNRAEYDRTVQDLLGLDLSPAASFPDDDVGHGFDTVGDVLSMPPLLVERYLAAAEELARAAIVLPGGLALRLEAEGLEREGRGNADADGFAHLWTNGSLTGRFAVPHTGEYRLRARAYGHQAGPDVALGAFEVDGRAVQRVEVPARRDRPGVYEARVRLTAGERRVGFAFLNDYYEPGDPDPGNRDRNLALDWLEVEGPLEPPALPASHRRIVVARPARDDKGAWRRAARQCLEPLAARAYRRPVTEAEVRRLTELVLLARDEQEPFERGLQVALTALLASPQFLFRVELDPRRGAPGHGQAHAVSEHELASRLSYFLWSSMPDEPLFELARAGRLRSELEAQVRRMLDHPRASALSTLFAPQWLQVRRLHDATPAPSVYPGFDEPLREAMLAETELLFEAILRENRSVLDLLDGDYTFVNERLARHYGIPGVTGERFRRVPVPPGRGGVLGHASVLTATSNPTRTSPVKRGKWVLEVLLDAPPPPPPPGAGSLPEGEAAGPDDSQRARLERHRRDPACASCHARLDPLGFGLERFDGVGAWREREGGAAVDSSGALPDGTTFDGPDGLRTYLRGQRRAFVRGLTRNLLVYGLGRGSTPADEAVLDEVLAATAPEHRLQDLLLALVRSAPFQQRRGEEER